MNKAEKLIDRAIDVCKNNKWKTRQDYRAANEIYNLLLKAKEEIKDLTDDEPMVKVEESEQ